MADFRALCAELLEALESTSAADMDDWPDLRARARAALAQPEPDAAPAPAASLVKRVSDALMESTKNQGSMARAAIREVAAWIREHDGQPSVISRLLEREAER